MEMEEIKKQKQYSELVNYFEKLPTDLVKMFLPSKDEDLETFYLRYKALRIWEKERNYVMEIQRNYNLPIRPNMSLKSTMIRVRLKMLRKRGPIKRNGGGNNIHGSLPTDPLE